MFNSKFYDEPESIHEDIFGTSPDKVNFRPRRPSRTQSFFKMIKRSLSLDKSDDKKEDFLAIPRLMLHSLSISQQIINSPGIALPEEEENVTEKSETFQSQTPRLIRRKCIKGRTSKEKFDLPYELKRRKSISSLYDDEDGGKKKENDQSRLFVPEQVYLYERLSFKGIEDFQADLNRKSGDRLSSRELNSHANLSRKLSVKPQPGTVRSLVKIFESKSNNKLRTKRSVSCICEDCENEKVDKEEITEQKDAAAENEIEQKEDANDLNLNLCPSQNGDGNLADSNSDVQKNPNPDTPEDRNSLKKENDNNYDIIRHVKRKSNRSSRNENEDSGYFNGESTEDISNGNKDEILDECDVVLRKHSNDSGFSSYVKNRRLKSLSDDSNRLSELSNESAPISTDSDSLSYSVGSYEFEEAELALIDDNQLPLEEESDNNILGSPLRYLKPLYQIYSRDADAAARKQITYLISNDTSDQDSLTSASFDLAKNKSRIYWKDTQRVRESGYLDKLPDIEKKKQEAKFEIYMSEASYVKSLIVLEKHYMKNLKFLTTNNMYSEKERIRFTEKDFKALFGNITEVRKSSENFLSDLDKLWQNDVLLNGIYDIMIEHATDSFRTYIRYSTQYLCMTKKLEELIKANGKLKQVLDLLSTHPSAQNLPLESFLALPIQRITRFPLLMKNVMQYIDENSEEYREAIIVLKTMKKLAQECDDEIEKKKRTEEMLHISQRIEFSPDIRWIPIMKSSRYLVLQTKVQHFVFRDKAMRKLGLQLFLFDDILMVTKKSGDRPAAEEHWTVIDYCNRDLVQAEAMDKLYLLGIPELAETNAISLTLQSNHRGEKSEMVVSFDKLSDRERWLAALTPSSSELFRKTLAAEPDCVQVTAINNYKASRPDELSLWIGDVVNIIGEPLEGWCRGEKLRNGKVGWFPQSATIVIEDDHVKMANMKLKRELESYDDKQDLNRKYSLSESFA